MNEKEKAVIETIKFYGLLERPLAELELYRYLSAQSGKISFFDTIEILEKSRIVKNMIRQKNGLIFPNNQEDPTASRIKKIKIKWLFLLPFFKAIVLTGSMNFFNCSPKSDFDLLIIARKDRIWSTRLFITALCEIFGMRRKAGKTENRFCLNCFVSEEYLEISEKAKPRNFYSAQEYGRAKLLIERDDEIFKKFQKQNCWIKNFLNAHPWPGSESQKLKEIKFFAGLVKIFEFLLSNKFGDWLEKKAGERQSRRINSNLKIEPADQICVSPTCLMFHPNSKSFEVMERMEKSEI